jgi:hypothetical protein
MTSIDQPPDKEIADVVDRVALLKEEYFHLQKTVEDFDQRTLSIKAWSVTTSMAGIAASFLHEKAAVICLLSAIASFSFWVIEALWKEFQQCYYPRIRNLEKAFREDLPQENPLQINTSWSITYHSYNLAIFIRVMGWPHVMLPHAMVMMIGIIVWAARSF